MTWSWNWWPASAQVEVAIEREFVATARELLVAEREAEAADIPEVNAESQKEFNKLLIRGNLGNN